MESRSSDRKLKPLPPDPGRHQDSAIAPELLLEEFCNRIEGGADTPDHLKVTRSEASSSRALATSSAREPLANRRLLYDEKRLPTFVGHPAASKFSSSATAEATLGALRA